MSARTMSEAESKKHLATLTLARRRNHRRKRAGGKNAHVHIKRTPAAIAESWRRRKQK